MDIIAPFSVMGHFGGHTAMVIGFVIGFLFGVALENAGFGSGRVLTAQFYLHDMAVYKVMFTAVVTSMFLVALTSDMGLLSFDQLFIPETIIWPQIVGGLLLGIGFIVGGYCPGTSMVSMGSGKIDGIVYVGGFMAGLLVFPWVFPLLEDLSTAGSLGVVTLYDWIPVPRVVLAGIWVVAAVASFFGVIKLEAYAKARWPFLKY